MPTSDNVNTMPDRRHGSPMQEDQKAEFQELKGMISECTRTVGVEVGRARKGHEIIIARLDRTDSKLDKSDANIADARGNGDRRLKEHDRILVDHAEEIKRLKQGDKDNRVEIKRLREGLDGVVKSVDQIDLLARTSNTLVSSLHLTQSDGFIAIGRQLAASMDTINQLRGDLKASNTSSSKKWGPNLPLKAWFGIGAGVIIAIVFVIAVSTGNIELIDKIKSAF